MDGRSHPRRLTEFNKDVLADIELRPAQERHVTVDGWDVQGWFIPGGDDKTARPLVLEIHGGPHTLYGWSPVWEFQVLAGAGIGVFYSNPRGSEGYGEAFNDANHRDWGPGPDARRPRRRRVTGQGRPGGSGSPRRDRRLVRRLPDQLDRRARPSLPRGDDLPLRRGHGDALPDRRHQRRRVGPARIRRHAVGGPGYFREISPVTYADRIKTPLLIQHSERDIRTTIGQAEAQFTVMRSLKKQVRLMRVPEETHELTRSGTPFRRVENLEIVRSWFSTSWSTASAGCRHSRRSAPAADPGVRDLGEFTSPADDYRRHQARRGILQFDVSSIRSSQDDRVKHIPNAVASWSSSDLLSRSRASDNARRRATRDADRRPGHHPPSRLMWRCAAAAIGLRRHRSPD